MKTKKMSMCNRKARNCVTSESLVTNFTKDKQKTSNKI